MNSLEWEVFKRTGKIDHYLLMKENDNLVTPNINSTEFSEEIASFKSAISNEEE